MRPSGNRANNYPKLQATTTENIQGRKTDAKTPRSTMAETISTSMTRMQDQAIDKTDII